jgi:uncharacterized membrane protein SpoIIM required for sporulation
MTPPERFYQSRQADWQRLTALLDRAQRQLTALSPAEMREMGRLYRGATSDLAVAQRDFPESRIALYLNQLVGRAHGVVYQGEPLAVRRIVRFATQGYPRLARRHGRFIVTAALLFILPALLAALLAGRQPETARWLLPPETHALIPLIEQQELWVDIPVSERPYFSSFIMQNNIRVTFLAFGGGALAGLPTVWIMAYNGLLLGGLTGLTAHYGVGFELWTFVIGHGVVELTVIFIAGGAGLMLGWAILQPGLRRRRDALTLAAQDAVKLLVGCVPLLVIAGLIEGFISPNEQLHWLVKWSVGLGSGLMLYGYLFSVSISSFVKLAVRKHI